MAADVVPAPGSAVGLARAIRQGDATASDAVAACLERLDAAGRRLNAVITIEAERASKEAAVRDVEAAAGRLRGPLHGVPVTIKDVFDTEGLRTTWGSAGRLGRIPDTDAAAVARLRRAGAIVIAKTNCAELAVGSVTDNAVAGRASNPRDPSRTAGGSSGGGAVAVAIGGSYLDLASDTGGSIRQPASFCGVVGFKPTTGRVSQHGYAVHGAAAGLVDFNAIGSLARSVADVALCLEVTAGPGGLDPWTPPVPVPVATADRGLSGLRLGLQVDDSVETGDPSMAAGLARVAGILSDAGADVRPIGGLAGQAEALDLFFAYSEATSRYRYGAAIEAAGSAPHALVQRSFDRFRRVSLQQFIEITGLISKVRSEMIRALGDLDAVVSPAVAWRAPRHEEAEGRRHVFLTPYNVGGWPALVVPGPVPPDELPFGVQIAARPWDDRVVFQIGSEIEAAIGPWRPVGPA